MKSLWLAATGQHPNPDDYRGTELWSNPERSGWLTKQGDYIKQGKLFWFKDFSNVTHASTPRGVIPVGTCLTVKGAEDIVNKPYSFELSTGEYTMYFIAVSERAKEEWINAF
ncbi:pleckstrin homology domain-containing protein 1-like [Mangifera indica]|uniref:pleckstrin homology domain-containing protein 1-like n=1 Tax=Mangifera indica TaxID=29780 RepID=UPI001CFA00CC|nr:pleckstrin homology domain-containing protein 1-like [Mangifera indica]